MAAIELFSSRAVATQEAAQRVLPQNVEAEQALLGAIIINNDAYDRVSDFLKPEHFHEPVHQRIYENMAQLIRSGKIATPITLKTFLSDLDLGGVSIAQYLARLASEATTIINAGQYMRMHIHRYRQLTGKWHSAIILLIFSE